MEQLRGRGGVRTHCGAVSVCRCAWDGEGSTYYLATLHIAHLYLPSSVPHTEHLEASAAFPFSLFAFLADTADFFVRAIWCEGSRLLVGDLKTGCAHMFLRSACSRLHL